MRSLSRTKSKGVQSIGSKASSKIEEAFFMNLAYKIYFIIKFKKITTIRFLQT
jgi:hypothetical protein